MKRRTPFLIPAVTWLFLFSVPLTASPAGWDKETELELRAAANAALAWLHEQKVPNSTVQAPVPWRRNLVISYRIPQDDPAYPYLKGRSYIYDSALAAIACAMSSQYKEAEDILLALLRQLRADGSLWFGVNVHNEWPSEDSRQGALIRSGASAWAGYAATFYLRKRMMADPEFSTQKRVERRILQFARMVADRLLSLQVSADDDPRRGLITGGQGTYTLQTGKDGAVSNRYSDASVGWVSAEHNIDAYFLFADLAALTGEKMYRQAAQKVAEGLLRLWDQDERQLIQGIKEEGSRDTALPLDTSSWGSVFLRASGQESMANETLRAGMARFQLSGHGRYAPYARDEVYQEDGVSRAYFDDPDIRWDQLDLFWPEGALGMALALLKAGNSNEALSAIRASAALTTKGGVHYASREVPHQFSTYPSVASTAWLVIAVECALDEENMALFWQGLKRE